MKDFHVAPVEMADSDAEEQEEAKDKIDESPLERFRRISKQVASQSANMKWNEVIRCATIEANSQIGRCKKRESFKNQQNLLKAMDQARKLVERGPCPPSPNHSVQYDVMDQTNQTLVELLKNISEEINEYSPNNTLKVGTSNNRSITPLQSLNVQLQEYINKSPNLTLKTKGSPRPLNNRSFSFERKLSPPQKSNPSPPKYQAEAPKSPKAPKMKDRSATPDSRKSFDSLDSIRSIPVIEVNAEPGIMKIDSPKLIDLRSVDQTPLKKSQTQQSPTKVFKRKAPSPVSTVVSRPASMKISNDQGMIPPPPSKEETKPLQIPILSTTPATPAASPKPLICSSENDEDLSISISEPPTTINKAPEHFERSESTENNILDAPTIIPSLEEKKDEASAPAMIAVSMPVAHSSTEKLMTSEAVSKDPPPSPGGCLRPGNKIDDVKTIKRQPRAGWL